MLIDYNLILSDAQDETTVDDHNSDNVIDLTATTPQFVEPLYFVFRIDTAIVSAGGGTLQIKLVTSASALLSAATTLWDSGTIANATVVAWTAGQIPYVIPVYRNATWLRYLGAVYTIGTAVLTAGKWDLLGVVGAPSSVL